MGCPVAFRFECGRKCHVCTTATAWYNILGAILFFAFVYIIINHIRDTIIMITGSREIYYDITTIATAPGAYYIFRVGQYRRCIVCTLYLVGTSFNLCKVPLPRL